ncbi:hypothetical protein [Polyangium spumosum]|uniref:Uncharacterized protein n=1 Tax=Polyangium spumosum TaxID=889282 RepID=A0A6N7PK18_9BACT|nr:hypothetical protein [Polyangium spumosum]MRG90550.1 hypothetical protein [Polyangium spumosum]
MRHEGRVTREARHRVAGRFEDALHVADPSEDLRARPRLAESQGEVAFQLTRRMDVGHVPLVEPPVFVALESVLQVVERKDASREPVGVQAFVFGLGEELFELGLVPELDGDVRGVGLGLNFRDPSVPALALRRLLAGAGLFLGPVVPEFSRDRDEISREARVHGEGRAERLVNLLDLVRSEGLPKPLRLKPDLVPRRQDRIRLDPAIPPGSFGEADST